VPTINVVVVPKRGIVSDDSVATEPLGVRHCVLQACANVTLIDNIVVVNVSRTHPTYARRALEEPLAGVELNRFDATSGLLEKVAQPPSLVFWRPSCEVELIAVGSEGDTFKSSVFFGRRTKFVCQ